MRYVIGISVLAAVALLVALAIHGVTFAIEILATVVAIFVMIVLGVTMGGRSTPNRAPYVPGANVSSSAPIADDVTGDVAETAMDSDDEGRTTETAPPGT